MSTESTSWRRTSDLRHPSCLVSPHSGAPGSSRSSVRTPLGSSPWAQGIPQAAPRPDEKDFSVACPRFFAPLVIVDDLHAIGMAPAPLKHQAPLVINPDGMEPFPFAFQTLHVVVDSWQIAHFSLCSPLKSNGSNCQHPKTNSKLCQNRGQTDATHLRYHRTASPPGTGRNHGSFRPGGLLCGLLQPAWLAINRRIRRKMGWRRRSLLSPPGRHAATAP